MFTNLRSEDIRKISRLKPPVSVQEPKAWAIRTQGLVCGHSVLDPLADLSSHAKKSVVQKVAIAGMGWVNCQATELDVRRFARSIAALLTFVWV